MEITELVEQLEARVDRLKRLNRRLHQRMADLNVADSLLSDLLAVIHGDGGHYQAKHGTIKAVKDAIRIVRELRAECEDDGK
jgi:hypothetical protein